MNNSLQPKTNTMAIVGFILAWFLGPIGAILCMVALSQIKKRGEKGKGLAIAGIIIGLIPIVIIVIISIFFTSLVWPEVKDSITTQTVCTYGSNYTLDVEDMYIDCGSVSSDGSYTCDFVIAGESGTVTCESGYK